MAKKKKNKPSNKSKNEATKSEVEEIDDESICFTTGPHVLANDVIELWKAATIKERERAPPPTPDYEQVGFEQESIECVPTIYPSLDLLKIPYVRMVGIKSCIEFLGRFFNCVSYKSNHLHFWFLDIITDCLWKLQDDFQLADDDQKKVLEYFLYFFKIISAKVNSSRQVFLRTFTETIYLIGDLIEEGCLIIPTPDALFSLMENMSEVDDGDFKNVLAASTSSITDFESDDVETYVGMKLENDVHIFNLKNRTCTDNLVDDISKASSLDPKRNLSDDSLASPATIVDKEQKETHGINNVYSNTVVNAAMSLTYNAIRSRVLTDPNMDQPQIREEYIISDFYHVDVHTPPRFLSSELAFARYSANEIAYLAGGAEEDFECGDLVADADSSSTSGLAHTEHNGDDESDKYDKSQLSDMSKYLLKADPCNVITHTPHKKKSAKIQEQAIKTLPAKQSTVSVVANVPANRQGVVTPPPPPLATTPISQDQANPSFSSFSHTSSTSTINHLIRAGKELHRDGHLKVWRDYHLCKQRLQNMENPNVGWQPDEEHLVAGRKSELSRTDLAADRLPVQGATPWRERIRVSDYDTASRHADERKRINLVITSAIIDCVFEFLYDNFHFTLIHLANQSTPDLLHQNVNDNWNCPKIPKSEFSRPPRVKVKTPKTKKEKKLKSKSKTNSQKSASKKSKSSKKSAKRGKRNGIEKLKKSAKASKKSGKLSKSEIDRIKKEKARSEEERRKTEENIRYIFPLTDAATDDLFKNIFENWVKLNEPKVKKTKKGRNGKKAKLNKK